MSGALSFQAAAARSQEARTCVLNGSMSARATIRLVCRYRESRAPRNAARRRFWRLAAPVCWPQPSCRFHRRRRLMLVDLPPFEGPATTVQRFWEACDRAEKTRTIRAPLIGQSLVPQSWPHQANRRCAAPPRWPECATYPPTDELEGVLRVKPAH